jgi:hypothetical protein
MLHQQTWDPDRYARNARFVADLGAPVVDLLAPRAGERILDLGCAEPRKQSVYDLAIIFRNLPGKRLW